METLLDIKNLSVSFDTYAGTVKAVRNVSFQVKEGETVAVVGESGCGKTVTAKSIMGLVKSPPGRVEDGSQILFEGKNIFDFTKEEWEKYRGEKCAIIFQDALAALNPTIQVGKQIGEMLKLHTKMNAEQIIAVVREEDKETQWVDDFMDALASETQLERIAEQNKPSLAWKVLFEVAE